MAQSPANTRWSPQLVRTITAAGASVDFGAAKLAKRGIPVFPCAPSEKQPLTPHGFHDASTDAEVVAAWWRRWPEANIGIPTGAASGVDVVDVDVHARGDGFAAFSR